MVEVPPNLSNILRLQSVEITIMLTLRRKILRLYSEWVEEERFVAGYERIHL